jgi:hypothetical protein
MDYKNIVIQFVVDDQREELLKPGAVLAGQENSRAVVVVA